MTNYKVIVEDRNYIKWNFCNANTFDKLELVNVEPLENKLFNNDIFQISKHNEIKIIHSSIRVGGDIPGVLILKDNKTYGRKKNKLLYKCVPDDMRIPAFLIPYEMKHIGFSKVFTNIYVTFSFDYWDEKHPHGLLKQVIGPVDILDNYYEYQLYCKSLNSSIQKFTKDTSKSLKLNSHDAFIDNICLKYPNLEDRTSWNVFTIDGPTTTDYDDAFSIKTLENGNQCISIYISNVTIWMDVLNLWSSFSQRISTIYLPDRKRPMLPTILSDCLCSLQSGNSRIAFLMDIIISKEYSIIDIKYTNAKIKVFKNFIYDEPDLLKNNSYQILFSLTKEISKKYNYISNIRNSNDVVAYLMILMNYHTSTKMLEYKNGIFRSSIIQTKMNLPSNLPEDVGNFVKLWNSSICQYVDGSNIHIKHEILNIDSYIHITSPIRRLVDLLNIIKFQQNTQMIELSEKANEFYEQWIKQLDYINITMRAIRKVQNDCSLLDICSNNPEIMDKMYDGYSFDKLERNDGLFQYIVYLPELKLVSRITSRVSMNNFEKQKYKLFLFHNEDRFKKKIRLQLLEA
jgi:exoribonuclease R